jgi:hypothetical protein
MKIQCLTSQDVQVIVDAKSLPILGTWMLTMFAKDLMKALNLITLMKKTAVVAEKVSEFNLYNPRFNYQPLNRVTEDGRRLYDTPGGKLPSVTTILEKTKPEEKKQALQEWRNRVGHAQAQAITTEAANRGTRMHTYLEHYVKTGELKEKGSNPFGWASHDMAQTVIDDGLKKRSGILGCRNTLVFSQALCRHQRWCRHTHERRKYLDYKQTNKPKRQKSGLRITFYN